MRQLFPFLFIGLLIACGSNDAQNKLPIITEDLNEYQIDSVLEVFQFEYEKPIILDSSDYLLIPISTEILLERKSYSSSKFDGYGYSSNEFPRYWNILFYHKKTGSTRLLTEEKVRISNIHLNESDLFSRRNKREALQRKILYTISDIDYNNDQKLDAKDPESLFVSELNGEHLLKLSPLNEDLVDFTVLPNSNQILLQTRRDTHYDSIFDQKDDLFWYKATFLEGEWNITQIIDSAQNQKIKHLYFEQWLKKKQP